MGMEFVEKKILNNRTIDMAEHAVLMMCSYIPGRFSDQVTSRSYLMGSMDT